MLKSIYTRIGISERTGKRISSILLFFTSFFLVTKLTLSTVPAYAFNFTSSNVRPADVLDYESLGYTYDTLPIRGSNTNLRVRKNAASLTPAEIDRFVNAIATLKRTIEIASDGTPISLYDQFVATHLGTSDVAGRMGPNNRTFSDPAHRNSAFLPWHRNYLREFERMLQVVDPTVTLPYWDFTDRTTTPNIIFQNNYMGPNGGNGGIGGGAVQTGYFSAASGWLQRADLSGSTWTGKSTNTQPLTRFLRGLDRLPTTTQVNQALAQTTYENFRNNIEFAAHAGAHGWVGGSTLNVASSPNDPIFWMLHANIDRIWAQWQLNGHWGSSWYPASGRPLGHNLNDGMWPWDGGRMRAAADLQALIPTGPTTQASHDSFNSREFKVAETPEELLSDRTGRLYNPFESEHAHHMEHIMPDTGEQPLSNDSDIAQLTPSSKA